MTAFKFSFDGCGINDATDEYRPRIATLTRVAGDWAHYRAHGELMAQAPALRDALRDAVASLEYAAMVIDPPKNSTFMDTIAQARAVLNSTDKVTL